MSRHNYFCSFILVGILLVTSVSCNKGRNVFVGSWKFLWRESDVKSLDITIHFDPGNTFRIEAIGGAETEKIRGIYNFNKDSFFVRDTDDKPLKLCDYADTGVYLFSVKGDSIFFKTIHDNCERRKLSLELGLVRAK